MTDTLDAVLERADGAWRDGRLRAARDGYARALAIAPASWHAAFQVAWIDAAFTPPPRAQIDALRRPGLPPAVLELVEMLDLRSEEIRHGEVLEARIDDWDIERLRGSARADDAAFWEASARRAAMTREYGLAAACYDEALRCAPQQYLDPPAEMARAPHEADHHLRIVRSVAP